MRGWTSGRPSVPCGDDAVDEGDGLVVEGHHSFGVELAEGDLQPRTVARDLVDAVELEVQQLSDAKPTGPLKQQRVGGQAVLGALECFGEAPVGVDGQITRQCARKARHVGAEDELAGRGLLPAPLGDVGKEARDRPDPPILVGRGDRLAGLGVDGLR